jgi:serine phosphatase RsbU (regulator of sigma subunit)
MFHRPSVDEMLEGNLLVSDGLVSLAEPLSAGEDPSCKRICDHYRQEAQRIQTLLLPTRAPQHEAVEIAFRFTPFSEVGGDFADFFALPDGLIGLYLGDVVGKGLPAAMYGALVMGRCAGFTRPAQRRRESLAC